MAFGFGFKPTPRNELKTFHLNPECDDLALVHFGKKKNTCRVDHLYEEFWFVFHFNNERMNKMKKFALPNDEKK